MDGKTKNFNDGTPGIPYSTPGEDNCPRGPDRHSSRAQWDSYSLTSFAMLGITRIPAAYHQSCLGRNVVDEDWSHGQWWMTQQLAFCILGANYWLSFCYPSGGRQEGKEVHMQTLVAFRSSWKNRRLLTGKEFSASANKKLASILHTSFVSSLLVAFWGCSLLLMYTNSSLLFSPNATRTQQW